MSIERKCDNCANRETGNCDSTKCYPSNNYEDFVAKEELVRADEKKHWQEVRDKEAQEAYKKGMEQAYFDILMKIEYETKGIFIKRSKLIKLLSGGNKNEKM